MACSPYQSASNPSPKYLIERPMNTAVRKFTSLTRATYGLSLVPAGVAVMAYVGSRRRIGEWALMGLGVLGVATVLSTLT
jgi:drug/metabolite transporter (DMT)-like permease